MKSDVAAGKNVLSRYFNSAYTEFKTMESSIILF